MPAPISVIIPAFKSAEDLPACLSHLFPGLEAGLIREVIVSGVPSNDATRDIAEAAGAIWVEGEKGRGTQLKLGAEVARGEWLLFLHVDTWLDPAWCGAAKAHIASEEEKAGAFQLAFRSTLWRARWVAGLANLRSRLLGMPYGDQGLLISRTLYDRIGGYHAVPLMEDVSIARRIGRGRLAILPAIARTSGARQEADGWLKRSFQNIWLVARYFCGTDPQALAKAYYRE